MTKKLTIIIPAYNVENYIEKALNSIINQININWNNIQVLIINDGSTDKTELKIKTWLEAKKNYPFEYIKKENGNWGSVINYVKNNNLIQGQYFSILDADDFYNKNCFDEVLQIINKNKYDLILSNFQRINENNQTKSTNVIWSAKSKELKKNKAFTPWSIPMCKFFKTSLFLESDDLKEGVSYQDQILFFSFLIKSQDIYFIKKDLGYYFVSRPNSSSVASWNIDRIEIWMENMNKLLSYNIKELSAYVNMMTNYCYINTKNKEDNKNILINKENIKIFKSSRYSFLPFMLSWIAKLWFTLSTRKIIKNSQN